MSPPNSPQFKGAGWRVAGTGEGNEGRIEHLYIRRARHGSGWKIEGQAPRVDQRQGNLWGAVGIEAAQIDHRAALEVEEIDHAESGEPAPLIVTVEPVCSMPLTEI